MMLEAQHLYKSYADCVVLDDFSLRIESGEFLGIVGPSGCGKTTLLSILATLDVAQRGRILMRGEDLFEMNEAQLASFRNQHFGFVFQLSSLMMQHDVFTNVALPFQYGMFVPMDQIRSRVAQMLQSVGLAGYESHKAAVLSGGEQQRVAIARAMVRDPDVIFADEPTGNLDAVNSTRVLEILRRLNEKEGKTVVMVTHDRHAVEYCSRVIELSK